MTSVRNPALRYHGAKFRLAPWVMQRFPPHSVYVEAFGGSAGVLLQKPRSYAEVYNDLDGEVVNYFRVLRDSATRAQLIEAVELTPYARDEFNQAWDVTDDPIERARRIAVRAMMGFGSAGATKGSTGFRIDTRRVHGTAQHLWQKFPVAIAAAGERLSGVLIENRDAIDVMRQHDDVTTLHFVDPPYVHSTRTSPRRGGYRHELNDDGHANLIGVLRSLRGMVVLSGYASALYKEQLGDWEMHTINARAAGNRGAVTRTECLWMNPACVDALNRRLLLATA